MTYAEAKARLHKVEIALTHIKNSNTQHVIGKEKVEKLTVLKEGLNKRINLLAEEVKSTISEDSELPLELELAIEEVEESTYMATPESGEIETILAEYKLDNYGDITEGGFFVETGSVKYVFEIYKKRVSLVDSYEVSLNESTLNEEEEESTFTTKETKLVALEVSKALLLALREVGDEIKTAKAHHIEENSFEIYVGYKDDLEDEFSFYIKGNTLNLVDFSFTKAIGEVGIKPSGEPTVHKTIIKDNLVKHFRSLNETSENLNESNELGTTKTLEEFLTKIDNLPNTVKSVKVPTSLSSINPKAKKVAAEGEWKAEVKALVKAHNTQFEENEEKVTEYSITSPYGDKLTDKYPQDLNIRLSSESTDAIDNMKSSGKLGSLDETTTSEETLEEVVKSLYIQMIREEESPEEMADMEAGEETILEDATDTMLERFPTLKNVLVKLMTDDYKDFVDTIDWVSPRPSIFRINLTNKQDFTLKWTGKGFTANILGKRYALNIINEFQQALDKLARLYQESPVGLPEEEPAEEEVAAEPEAGEEVPAEEEESEDLGDEPIDFEAGE